MNQLFIQIEGARTAFEPGEILRGSVIWSFDRVPEMIRIQLKWATDGKGIQDQREIQNLALPTRTKDGTQPFEIQLPLQPYSFAGTLISLGWTLHAAAVPMETVARHPIVIAPGSKPLRLEKVAEDKRTKSWIRFGS